MHKNPKWKWISHNRVLGHVDCSKKPNERARNPNFDPVETKLLISLWGNPKIQKQLLTMHKKQPIIRLISEQMKLKGYNRTTEEINTRIKNLKCLYNRIKKEVDSGQLQGSPHWKHYAAMKKIIERPLFNDASSSSITTEDSDLMHPELHIVDNSDVNHLMSCQIKQEQNDFVEQLENAVNDEEFSESDEMPNCEVRIKIEPLDEDIIKEKEIDNETYTDPAQNKILDDFRLLNNSMPESSSNQRLLSKNRLNFTNLMLSSAASSSQNVGNKFNAASNKRPMKFFVVNTAIPQNNQNNPENSSQRDCNKQFTTVPVAATADNPSMSSKKPKSHDEDREKFPTIKNILNNIHTELKIRNKIDLERSELEKQRFEHEKQRFEYEKTFTLELLNLLQNKT